jgi:hypothetical protein
MPKVACNVVFGLYSVYPVPRDRNIRFSPNARDHHGHTPVTAPTETA